MFVIFMGVSQLVLNVKNKRKLPFLKELLKRMEFVEVVEPKKITKGSKQLLNDLDEAVDFVNGYKKNSKTKSFDQLMSEL
jgi:hypothetical protein